MEHYDWNDGWLFAPTFDPAIVRPECTGVELEPVRLPHTVKTLPYNYCNENEYQRVSGYRREFFAPKEWQGRTVLLTFGAVAHDATVFCNGRRVFHHSCGYTAFTVDLTSALHLGQKNVVAVRCDSREDLNIPPFGGQMDFLTYGGICRAVCLDVKETAYLRDIFIETKAEGGFRIYTATVGETVGCTLQAEIRSPSGSRAFYTGELSLPITGALNSVHPWSIEHPTLYTLTVRLIRPGTGGLPDRVLDEKSTRFGFRTIQFVAGGFYLNGQRVELRGLNRHQSYAYQGYAMPDSIQQLDAQLLKKQLGCNAVRTSHYPQSPAFLDACDELGLSALVEVHNEAEAETALRAGARIIGVNNRSLKDFSVDPDNSRRLRALIPREVLFVSESGVHSAGDVAVLRELGADGVLIGETLMRAADKKAALAGLRGGA